mgnify:CR=1 FL=1|jgi:hypothetical protein
MKTLIAIAAATASLAAVAPASAEPLSPKPVAGAAVQDGIPASKKLREQRVCFVDKITGSNIPTKECRTRSDWTAMGVKLPAGI